MNNLPSKYHHPYPKRYQMTPVISHVETSVAQQGCWSRMGAQRTESNNASQFVCSWIVVISNSWDPSGQCRDGNNSWDASSVYLYQCESEALKCQSTWSGEMTIRDDQSGFVQLSHGYLVLYIRFTFLISSIFETLKYIPTISIFSVQYGGLARECISLNHILLTLNQ